VRIAYRRATNDLAGQREVLAHPAQQREALQVLLTDIGPGRLELVQQDREVGRRATRPSGTELALEPIVETVDEDMRGEAVREDRLRVRAVEDARATLVSVPDIVRRNFRCLRVRVEDRDDRL